MSPLVSDLWVRCLGRTSITFGHALSLNGGSEIVSFMTRVFIRKESGQELHITEDERTEHFPADYNYDDIDLPTVEIIDEIEESSMNAIFSVPLGPQHFTNHSYIDPSAFADLALQGLWMKGHPSGDLDKSFLIDYHQVGELQHKNINVKIHDELPVVRLYHDSDLLCTAQLSEDMQERLEKS